MGAGGSPGCSAKARPCGDGALALPAGSLALTLQQVGDEQRRALVAAGQPPLCQVLLDLQGEEVPVGGTGARPGGSWVLG